MLTQMVFATVLLASSTEAAPERAANVLFDFSAREVDKEWRTVNDGVMGGRSDGRFQVGENGSMTFFGTLSLENNGGFASVRSPRRNLGLQEGDSIVTRVRGDGRRYTLNLYVPTLRVAYSYQVEFQSKKNEWVEVRVPLKDFVATAFGRPIRNSSPVNPQRVNSIGFLLADKNPGSFKLEVDWIKREAQARGKTE